MSFTRGAALLAVLGIGSTAYASAVSHGTPIIPSSANVHIAHNASGNEWPWRAYVSSNHTPPNLNISHRNNEPLAPGYLFLGPDTPAGSGYLEESTAYILTDAGDLVYAAGDPGTMNFHTQTYNGKPILTYWKGNAPDGVNDAIYNGQLNMLDQNYTLSVFNPVLNITTVNAGFTEREAVDCREQYITDRGTILILAFNKTSYDLTPVNGSANGWVLDNVIFEVDLATEEILFSWSALEHVSITQSKQPFSDIPVDGNGTFADPWDWFHCNAISDVNGDILVNARHTWSTLLVNRTDGSIIWTFEGQTGGDWGALKQNQTFEWQHEARAHNVTSTGLDISMSDNHNHEEFPLLHPTTAKVFHLELPPSKNFTPILTRELSVASDPIFSLSQGSYDPTLSNGNQLHFFGQIALFREYGPGPTGADLRYEAQFGGFNEVFSYRVYKNTWHGTPAAWNPNLVVKNGTAYVSWNGATDVEAWNVYTGQSQSTLKLVGQAKKKGFETMFKIPWGGSVVQLGAVQHGAEVRRSNVASI